MACPPRADLLAFSQGSLRGPQWHEVSSHLQICAECQAIFAAVGRGEATSNIGAPAAHLAEPVPSRIGRYVVLDQLGQGGMGRVYSAYHPELDRRVALKVLHAKTSDEAAGARLRREAQAMARLDHPNVVAVHDVGEDDGRLFLVMERVEGETLEQRMLRGPLPVADALSVIRQAGQGLAAAHRAGLVHRDLKPANILLSGDGRVRVADFGIARFAGAVELSPSPASPSGSGASELTQPGHVAGTPMSMAPEQVRGLGSDERSDQFSFCITAYKALYGEHPFDVTAPVAERFVAPRVPTPRGEPRTVRAALLRGLAPEPTERFPSMTELLVELERTPLSWKSVVPYVAAGVGLTGVVVTAVTALAPPLVPGCDRSDRTLSASWGGPQRARLERAFSEAAGDASRGPADLVTSTFDAYARDWEVEVERACEQAKSSRRGQRTPPLECLEGQRLAFLATVDVLSSADRGMLDRAPMVAAALVPPTRCSQPGASSSTPRMPSDPSLSAAVQKVRIELASALANNLAGRPEKAEELLVPLRVEAQRLAFKPLIGEVAFATVETRTLSVAPEKALDAAQVAFAEAVAAGMDATAADVAAILAFINVQRNKAEVGAEWLTVSRALLERAGGDPLVEARLENSISVVLDAQDKELEGHPHQVRAAELRAQVLGPRHPRTLSFMSNVAASYIDLCRYPEAGKVLQPFADPDLARRMPSLSSVALGRLVTVHSQAGQWADAERVARLAVEVDADPRAGTRRALGLTVLALALSHGGKREEAVATEKLALDSLGDQSSNWAAHQSILLNAALVLAENEQLDAAKPLLDKLPAAANRSAAQLMMRAQLALPSSPKDARALLEEARSRPGCRAPSTDVSLNVLEAEIAQREGRSDEVKAAKERALQVMPLDRWSEPLRRRFAALDR